MAGKPSDEQFKVAATKPEHTAVYAKTESHVKGTLAFCTSPWSPAVRTNSYWPRKAAESTEMIPEPGRAGLSAEAVAGAWGLGPPSPAAGAPDPHREHGSGRLLGLEVTGGTSHLVL